MSKPALFFGIRKKPGTFSFRFVLFCFVMLLGSPATGQSETNGKLAPQDTIELHVSYTLIGRYLEALLVNNTFTIDSAGALYLPMIGQIQAAGLREDELAKLINDRLQAKSGLRERAVTFIRRMQNPSSRASGSGERPRNGPDLPSMIVPGAKEPTGAQSSVNGSGMPGRRPGATTQQPLERERTTADALQRSPPPALMELEMAERRAAMAARADLTAARAQAAQEASAASRARQAAEVLANEQRELATRRRAKAVALEQELLAARREIDALKGSAQKPAAEREEARRALAAVQRELDAMRRVARDGSAQARAGLEAARAQAAQEASAASRARQAAEVLANEQRELATRRRAKAVALEQELLAARREIDALKGSAQKPAAEREEARRALAAVQRELDAMRRVARDGSAQARAGLEAARAQAAQEASAASRARQAAEVLANEQRELATRRRAKAVALEQELLAARREIDALKGSAQKPAAEREEARRALAAVQRELDAMRRVARDGSAQERAIADKQERALEGQRQTADGLARELAAVQREVEDLKAKATLASLAKAAEVKVGLAAEASLADARRVIDEERQKAGMLERDLAAARQSLAALEATADQAAAAQATAMRDLQAAEAATKRLSEALLLQRQRADEATGELKTARQERDAAKQEAIRLATAQREVLEDEQGKAISLARELAAARKEVDTVEARGQRGIARVENAPKARATMRASASGDIQSKPRSGRKSELREVRKTEVRRSSRSVALPTPPLPARLLPTRPPM